TKIRWYFDTSMSVIGCVVPAPCETGSSLPSTATDCVNCSIIMAGYSPQEAEGVYPGVRIPGTKSRQGNGDRDVGRRGGQGLGEAPAEAALGVHRARDGANPAQHRRLELQGAGREPGDGDLQGGAAGGGDTPA